MSLYAYRVFATVVEQKSFAKAARLLELSPSAVSHTVSKLEQGCGFPLLVRGKRTAVLTDGGQDVYRYVREMLTTADMLDKRVMQIRGAFSGEVTLGILDSVAVSWLPDIVSKFRNTCPDIELHILEKSYTALIDDVVNHRCDAAIVSHLSIRELSTPLQFIPVFQDPFVAVSPEDSAADAPHLLEASALKELPVILLSGGDETDVTVYLDEQQVALHPASTGVSNTSLVAMVQCGMGHAVTTQLSLSGCDLTGLTVRRIVPFGYRTLGIITHNPKFLTPAAKKLISCVKLSVPE